MGKYLRELKLLLINLLVFTLLIILVYGSEIDQNVLLDTGIGFYSMELGFLLAKGKKGDNA